MELIHHNKINAPSDRTGRTAKISFQKNGVFSINRPACEKLKLKAGDCVSIAQEKEEPRNCYLYKDKDGFDLREHSTSKSLIFVNKSTMVKVLDSVGYDSSITHSFLIGMEPTVEGRVSYFGILIPEV